MDWDERTKSELEDLRRDLDQLRDERSIAHLMHRYLKACDELKDPDLIASYFTEDAVWEGQGHFAEFGATRGRDAIRAMFVDNPTILPFTAHFVTNPVIVIGLDPRA